MTITTTCTLDWACLVKQGDFYNELQLAYEFYNSLFSFGAEQENDEQRLVRKKSTNGGVNENDEQRLAIQLLWCGE